MEDECVLLIIQILILFINIFWNYLLKIFYITAKILYRLNEQNLSHNGEEAKIRF